MDSEKIVEIFRNEDFMKRLAECASSEEKVELLGENGIMIGLDEYKRLEQIVSETRNKNVTEMEIENVSGGLSSTAKNVLATIGVLGASGAALWGISKWAGKGSDSKSAGNGDSSGANGEKPAEPSEAKSSKVRDGDFPLSLSEPTGLTWNEKKRGIWPLSYIKDTKKRF